MAMKQTGRKVYKTMQGKTVDMDLLRQRNELTPAVGNAKVNARGDELGAGGRIIKKREDVIKEYYNTDGPRPAETTVKRNAQPVNEEVSQPTKDLTNDWVEPDSEDDDWVEDDDGNFVKKGE